MPEIIQLVLIVDNKGRISDSAPKQYARDVCLWDLACPENGSQKRLLEAWFEAVKTDEEVGPVNVTMIRPCGDEYYAEVSIMPLQDTVARTFRVTGRVLMDTELLSDRECEALRLVAKDLDTNEIAERMNIEARTVRRYVDSLKEKLNVKGLAGLAGHRLFSESIKA